MPFALRARMGRRNHVLDWVGPEVPRDVAMAIIFVILYMGCTLMALLIEYDWTVRVRRRCDLMSNYFDHVLIIMNSCNPQNKVCTVVVVFDKVKYNIQNVAFITRLIVRLSLSSYGYCSSGNISSIDRVRHHTDECNAVVVHRQHSELRRHPRWSDIISRQHTAERFQQLVTYSDSVDARHSVPVLRADSELRQHRQDKYHHSHNRCDSDGLSIIIIIIITTTTKTTIQYLYSALKSCKGYRGAESVRTRDLCHQRCNFTSSAVQCNIHQTTKQK